MQESRIAHVSSIRLLKRAKVPLQDWRLDPRFCVSHIRHLWITISPRGMNDEISIDNSMICSDFWHKYHEWHLCQISHTIRAITCLYYNLRNSVINAMCLFSSSYFCRVRFVGKQISFEVLVFGPAGPDIVPGRCTFLSIMVS